MAGDATIRSTLARLGVEETALGSVGATIGRRPGSAPAVPLPTMRVAASSEASPEADLVERGVLGKGGMGVVRLATQRSLDRDVAVKTALSSDGARVAALVREARVMGRLEHPNIVPAHALGLDAGGPVLVMKRVEGVSWATLLRDEAHPGWAGLLSGHDNRLRAHVEILAQICRALAFAHSRGVIHRDLKPENVMVGAFGEVLLLDWGLALRLDEREHEPAGIVGTPGYLPPEMALGDPRAQDERTDVYLLGATLYEVLTGRMPHAAETALGALASSLGGDVPPLPEGAHPDLGALAMAALGPKETRPASADAFRAVLARILTSHEADVLVRGAKDAMARARVAAEAHGVASPEALRPLVEARFALVSARAMRPDDPGIETELEHCLVRLVEREIALRSAAGARALLPELRAPAPELTTRLEVLERELEKERKQAETARRAAEADDIRSMQPVFMGGFAAVLMLSLGLFFGDFGVSLGSPRGQVTWQLLVYGGLALCAILLRRRLATPRARRLTAFLFVWFSYGLFHGVVGIVRGAAEMDWGSALVSGTLLATVGALTLLPGLWLTVPVHASAWAACVAWPEHGFAIFGAMFWVNAPIVLRASWIEFTRPTAA